MLLPPEPKEEIGVLARQLLAAMQAHVTPHAHGDLRLRSVRARPAMVHDQSLAHQTDLAAAVSREDRFAVPAEEKPRMPAPIVTPSAETARYERGTAAGPAPPVSRCA